MKFLITKEMIIDEYVNKEKTIKQLAIDFNRSERGMKYTIISHGISIRKKNYEEINELFLRKEYIENKKSSRKIGQELGVGKHVILRKLEEYNIDRRSSSRLGRLNEKPYPCKKLIEENERFGKLVAVTAKNMWDLFLKQGGKCAISGVALNIKSKSSRTASLDRINSNLDYTLNNVQWVHKIVNIMKGKLTDAEFLEWCKVISNHNKEK